MASLARQDELEDHEEHKHQEVADEEPEGELVAVEEGVGASA